MASKATVFVIVLVLLTSCSGLSPQPTQTPYPTYTLQPTYTPFPTPTPIPTATSEPAPTATEAPPTQASIPTADPKGGIIAKNVHMVQEQNGIQVILERLLVTEPSLKPGGKLDDPLFEDSITYVQPIFVITNNTDKEVRISDFMSSLISANGEQVPAGFFYSFLSQHPFLKGILPGSTIHGPIWTGLTQHTWNQVTKVVVKLPYFVAGEEKVTDDFLFIVEIDDWTLEPLPDSLK